MISQEKNIFTLLKSGVPPTLPPNAVLSRSDPPDVVLQLLEDSKIRQKCFRDSAKISEVKNFFTLGSQVSIPPNAASRRNFFSVPPAIAPTFQNKLEIFPAFIDNISSHVEFVKYFTPTRFQK